MRIKNLTLNNIRNYSKLFLEFSSNINVFIGENAQGKTNILEAIYFAALGRSHRTTIDAELINWQAEAARINILFTRLEVENNISITLQKNCREILLNRSNIKPKELIGNLNVIMFSPEDLSIIKGMPVNRRRFLDIEISQADPAYYKLYLKYNRVLAQRNNLLKKIRDNRAKADFLDPWDEQIGTLAEKILKKRLAAVKKLAMLANLMQRRITGRRENLTITYQRRENDIIGAEDNFREWYLTKLREMRNIDIRHGNTGVGPHRDDLVFKVNDVNLRTYGSQGQQRTGVLALKLAELEFIKSETGEYPVMLLDDVMSELDGERRECLLAFIKDKIQTFITSTDEILFKTKLAASYYQVKQGQVFFLRNL